MDTILIEKDTTLKQIKEAFQTTHPMLKVEFYHTHHGDGEGSAKTQLLTETMKVSEVSGFGGKESLNISADQKVSELERSFSDQFGLSAQIFRLSGTVWIQTITTDEWSLNDQNNAAKEFSQPL